MKGGRRRILILVILCFSIFLSVRALGIVYPAGAFLKDAGGQAGDMGYAPGEVLVKFSEDPGFREAHILERIFLGSPKVVGNDMETNALNREAGILNSEAILGEENLYRLEFSANPDMEALAEEYEAIPAVEYAEPNYIREAMATTPNDPSFPTQWNLNQTSDKDIDAPEAWDIEKGNSSIIIAVIDTGVDWDHPDLAGNIWNNTDEIPANSVDDDGNGYVDDTRGYDFVDSATSCASGEDCDTEDNDPMDYYGHGTHCSGIAAAATNNSIGIAGVCWNCTIMPVRAGYQTTTDWGALSVADIIQALHYAADNGAHIISMSFGGGYASAEEDAVKYAYSRGVVLVAAAGNSNTNTKFYPAALNEVIAVSSTYNSDTKSSFSNYGPWVDVAAPGSSIYSTLYNDTYDSWSGTSMAAPHVAGLAGLILSRNSSFSSERVRSIIMTSVDVISFSVYMGTGRINAYRAVQINSTPVAVLDQAMGDSALLGTVQINGTANGTGFLNYSVYYGSGLYPSSWVLIGNYTKEVNSSNLTSWDTRPLADGQYTLWLSVFDTSGQEANETLPVTLDNPQYAPIFSNYAINATPSEDDDTQLNVTVTDDYFIDTVVVEVSNHTASKTNYTIITNLSSTWYFTLHRNNYSAGENMTWFWYANDTAGNLNSSIQQRFTTRENTTPSAAILSLNTTSSTNLTTQDLECWGKASDDDLYLTAYIKWWNGSEYQPGLMSHRNGVVNGTTTLLATLGSGNTTEMETWNCSVIFSDGRRNGTIWTNASLRIRESLPPSFSGYAINATPNEDQDVEMNVTITESYLDVVMLELNNGSQTANYTVRTNLSSTWYFTLNHGNYTAHDNVTWFWYANDSSANLNRSHQQNLTVANRMPSPPVHSSPVSNYNSSSRTLTLQWSASMDNDAEDIINYYIYINDTLNASSAQTSVNISFPEGQWNWNLTADDGYGNSSRSQDWYFRVDATPISSINYTSPTPGNGSSQTDEYIYVNATLSEAPDACLLEWRDGTPANESMTPEGTLCHKNMTGLSVFNYSFMVYANDSAGNWNSSRLRTVEIFTGAPAVNISPPAENAWKNTGNVTFLYSAAGANLDYCLLYLSIGGWGANQTNSSPLSGIQGSFSQGLPDGDYTWNIMCNNTGGSSWYPSNLTLHIDTVPPAIALLHPENRTYPQAPGLNFSWWEANPDTCWYWNGTGNTTISGCANLTAISGSEGQNLLILYMNDSAGNTESDSIYWSLDTIKPLITLISPDNASTWTSAQTVTFRYNLSDAGIANCSLIINGSLDQADTSVTVNSTQEFSKSLGNGNHVWQVNCTDMGGLENSSLPYNLTVSYSPPEQQVATSGGGGTIEAIETALISSKSWSIINPGVENGMAVKGIEALDKIAFTAKERITEAEIRVEALEGQPEGAGSPEGEPYQFLEIKHKGLEEGKLENLTITFSVNMSWIEENMIDISTIALNRHSGGAWQKLPTALLAKDSKQANFTTESPGFSYFAVTGEKLRVVHAVCAAGERRCLGNELQECESGGLSWLVIENCTQGCNESIMECNTEPKKPEPEKLPRPAEEEEVAPGEGIDYIPHILITLVVVIMALALLPFARKSGKH